MIGLGKIRFIYRLLMLPTERLNIFLSKLVTILLATLALVAFQYFALLIEKSLFDLMLQEQFRSDVSLRMLIVSNPMFNLILPKSIDGIVIMYGLGAVTVTTTFTGIIMERSFRIKGIALAVIYVILNLAIVFAPGILNYELMDRGFLYESEVLMVTGVLILILTSISILISRKLLNDRIRV